MDLNKIIAQIIILAMCFNNSRRKRLSIYTGKRIKYFIIGERNNVQT